MREQLQRAARYWRWIAGCYALVVVLSALQAQELAGDGQRLRVFLLTLSFGLLFVLPLFALAQILWAISTLHEASAPPYRSPRHSPDVPGLTVEGILDGPGSPALKQRILGDMVGTGHLSPVDYEAALADARMSVPLG